MPEDQTAVIFRKLRNGEIVALFPYIPGNVGEPWTCQSFIHVGQHGAANLHLVMGDTRPAAPEEYAALKRELESPPYEYRLRVIHRTPHDASAVREAELRRDGTQ